MVLAAAIHALKQGAQFLTQAALPPPQAKAPAKPTAPADYFERAAGLVGTLVFGEAAGAVRQAAGRFAERSSLWGVSEAEERVPLPMILGSVDPKLPRLSFPDWLAKVEVLLKAYEQVEGRYKTRLYEIVGGEKLKLSREQIEADSRSDARDARSRLKFQQGALKEAALKARQIFSSPEKLAEFLDLHPDFKNIYESHKQLGVFLCSCFLEDLLVDDPDLGRQVFGLRYSSDSLKAAIGQIRQSPNFQINVEEMKRVLEKLKNRKTITLPEFRGMFQASSLDLRETAAPAILGNAPVELPPLPSQLRYPQSFEPLTGAIHPEARQALSPQTPIQPTRLPPLPGYQAQPSSGLGAITSTELEAQRLVRDVRLRAELISIDFFYKQSNPMGLDEPEGVFFLPFFGLGLGLGSAFGSAAASEGAAIYLGQTAWAG